MIVLALDLSTKPGFAVLRVETGGKLEILHKSSAKYKKQNNDLEDYEFVKTAKCIAADCVKLVEKFSPDQVVIEQTNQGRSRTTQKALEFIHFAVLDAIYNHHLVGGKVRYMDSSVWRSKIKLGLTKEQRNHNKLVKKHFAKGKITWKHLSVAWVNEKFSLNLKLKDNDIADAICIAVAASTSSLTKSVSHNIDKLFQQDAKTKGSK